MNFLLYDEAKKNTSSTMASWKTPSNSAITVNKENSVRPPKLRVLPKSIGARTRRLYAGDLDAYSPKRWSTHFDETEVKHVQRRGQAVSAPHGDNRRFSLQSP